MLSPLTKKELKDFHDLLIQRKSRLIEEITIEKESFNNGRGPGDLIDVVTSLLERELDFSFTEKERKSLEEIDHALERIENNTYGICVDTQKPIPKSRLLVVPETLRTLKAQKSYESRAKKKRRLTRESLITHSVPFGAS